MLSRGQVCVTCECRGVQQQLTLTGQSSLASGPPVQCRLSVNITGSLTLGPLNCIKCCLQTCETQFITRGCLSFNPCDCDLTPAMAVNVKETRGSCKNVKTLTEICQSFILKYTHHVVWRRLDPPNPQCHEEFKPYNFQMRCPLPLARDKEEKNPDLFRKNLKNIRDYFSENLVRPVYNSLTEKCVKFVTNHLLQHGDIILQMILQDELSRSLVMNAKHIVYR